MIKEIFRLNDNLTTVFYENFAVSCSSMMPTSINYQSSERIDQNIKDMAKTFDKLTPEYVKQIEKSLSRDVLKFVFERSEEITKADEL